MIWTILVPLLAGFVVGYFVRRANPKDPTLPAAKK